MERYILQIFLLFLLCFFLNVDSNSQAQVTILTEANFDTEIGSGNNLWFVDFYAPWCGHCKKLDPVLNELVAEVESEINVNLSEKPNADGPAGVRIGKLDATMHKKVAELYDVKGFPTLLYFLPAGIHGKSVHGKYEGPRTKQGFMSFLRRMVSPPVTMIANPSELDPIYKEHSVIFLLNVPDDKKNEKNTQNIIEAFHMAAKASHTVAYFAISQSSPSQQQGNSNKVFLAKMESGRNPIEMSHINFDKPETVNKVDPESFAKEIEAFVTKNNRALITQFDAHNFKKLGSLGRKMVIAVVNPFDDAKGVTKQFSDAFDAAVSSLARDDADKYVFGFLDGVRWKSFLKQYGVSKKKLPTILTLDLETESYNVLPSVASGDITGILSDLQNGKLEMTKVEHPNMFKTIYGKLKDNYPLSLLCIVPFLILFWSFMMPYPEDKVKKS